MKIHHLTTTMCSTSDEKNCSLHTQPGQPLKNIVNRRLFPSQPHGTVKFSYNILFVLKQSP
jgi:hypothetical protein